MKPVSFDVDHHKLSKGIYMSCIQDLGEYNVVTFDFRMCKPYVDRPMTVEEAHTFEHVLSTYIREYFESSNIIPIYIGPMGCMTGFYVVLAIPKDNLQSYDVMIDYLIKYLLSKDSDIGIPAWTSTECGNVNTLNLNAKYSAWGKFKEMIDYNPRLSVYPK